MRKLVCTLVLMAVSFAGSAQLPLQLDSLFQSYYRNGLFEGTALVADSSGIVYHKSFGIASRDHDILNDHSTIFRLGSLEKQFTAMLTLQLVEKGRLRMQGRITDYLPEYRKATGGRVTIEQLLTHTSGIPNYTALPNVWEDSLQLSYRPEYILQQFCSGDLEFTPGTKYKYSNTGYFILALIIERVTSKQLSIVLKENIFVTAGMQHTGLDDGFTPLPHRAMGYYRLGETYINEPYIYPPNAMGAASIYSTAYDLYLWDRLLYGERLLSARYLKEYTTSKFTIDPDYAYGYGWEFTRTVLPGGDTIRTMEHSGAIRAFRAVIFRVPAEKKCVILLSNCANQSGYGLFENIMELFRGRRWREPKKLLADTLYAIMQQGSVADAVMAYRQMKKNDSLAFDYGTTSLELLGERLLLLQRYESAVAVYRLAVEEYPGYTYGYYYLGKAYEKWGKREQAVLAYRQAVQRDRSSRAGRDAAFQIKYLNGMIKGVRLTTNKSRDGK